jgi:hypothetical protein
MQALIVVFALLAILRGIAAQPTVTAVVPNVAAIDTASTVSVVCQQFS